MASHRPERIAEAIREVVAIAILSEISDPRVQGVTVLRAEVAPDLRQATVFVTLMGTEQEQQLSLRGLKHAAGFLQSRVAARLQTRYTPTLTFKTDDGVKKSVAMSRLIEETLAADRAAHPSPDSPQESDPAPETGPAGEPA